MTVCQLGLRFWLCAAVSVGLQAIVSPSLVAQSTAGTAAAIDPDGALSAQLNQYISQSRLPEAEDVAATIAVNRRSRLGAEHPLTLLSLTNLAFVQAGRDNFAGAEATLARVRGIADRALAADDQLRFTIANNLASVYVREGRYREAVPLFQEAIAGRSRVLGAAAPLTLNTQAGLAEAFFRMGNYAAAEPILAANLPLSERALGAAHPSTVMLRNNLGYIYARQSRYAEAAQLTSAALEQAERVYGPDHPNTLASLDNMSGVLRHLGRLPEAENLSLRAVSASERVLGADAHQTQILRRNLAGIYADTNRLDLAAQLNRRVAENFERTLGADNPDTITAWHDLGMVYIQQRQFAEAAPLLERALAASQRVLGPDHENTLTTVNVLGEAYRNLGRYGEAEALFERALTREQVIGESNPRTLNTLGNLVFTRLDDPQRSSRAYEPASVLVARARPLRGINRGDQARGQRAGDDPENGDQSNWFRIFADAAWYRPGGEPARAAVVNDVYRSLQDAAAGASSEAVERMAVRRFGGGGLEALIRERDSLRDDYAASQRSFTETFASEPGPQTEQLRLAIRRDQAQALARLQAIDTRLNREFSDYYTLTSPTPLSIRETQALLRAEEGLILIVSTPFGTHVVAITRDGVSWHRAEANAAEVNQAVQRLRWDVQAAVGVTENQQRRWRAQAPPGRFSFDRRTAFALYRELIAPAMPTLANRSRVYVAAEGPLSSLPLAVLVTQAPQGADNDPEALRSTSWLADSFGLVNIPSVRSLALLRQGASRGARTGNQFVGIGDPRLGPPLMATTGRRRNVATNATLAQDAARGTRPALARIRSLFQLSSLPNTATELTNMRDALPTSSSIMLLGPNANEPAVRGADFSQARIIAFATHGLMTNQLGVSEPGLVLSPPAQATEANDGYLGASEVTTLHLNADWVILSACNTATSDDNGSGLGGLSRAFFYAGARNILATQWLVDDTAASQLTVQTIRGEASGLSRAEALQRAMRTIRMDRTHDTPDDSWAHPFYWAPYVLIGDGD